VASRPSPREPDRDDALRVTDPPEPPGGLRIFGGCALGAAVLLLLALGGGLALGIAGRFSDPAGAGEGRDAPPAPGAAVAPLEPGPEGSPTPAADPLADLRARYRPGPQVTLESLVPSGRLLPAVSAQGVLTGRTVDTPWVVPGARLDAAAAPAAVAGGPVVSPAPTEDRSRPLTLLPRTPAAYQVAARDGRGGDQVLAYVVTFEGYPGHFRLPATIPTELGHIRAQGSEGATIRFALQAAVTPDGRTLRPGEVFRVRMMVRGEDDEGRVGAPTARDLEIRAVGAGDVEVTLAMDEPTDLDLYVVDPAGQTVYYGNRNVLSGGHLDLDANAGCSRNLGVDNEHVFWPAGRAPSGTYRVYAANYESCIGNRPVGYRVTVRACGETAVLRGRFPGAGSGRNCLNPAGADPSWCQEAVTFDVPPCPPPS
jgi:hypothetical protein